MSISYNLCNNHYSNLLVPIYLIVLTRLVAYNHNIYTL